MTPIEQLLPALYRQTSEDTELQRVLTLMLEQAERDKDVTLEQLFPSTTSGWGLELWERAWGIPVDRTLSDKRRRDRILAKVKGTGTTTLEVIRAIAQSFSSYPAEVTEESALYKFVVWYLGTIGEVEHKQDLIDTINELKPAHLQWEIKYRMEQDSSLFVGAMPRQGDQRIVWEVDCT